MTGNGIGGAHSADVGNALSRALAPLGDDLVEWTARAARAVFGAEACSIALLSDDGKELVFTTATGGAESEVSGLRMPAGEGIAGWVATTGQPLAVDDLTGDPRFATNVATSTGYMPRAILAAPVETGDRLLGVIEILDRDVTRAGSDDDLTLLAIFARQAALALEASSRARRIGHLIAAASHGGVDGGPGADEASGEGDEDSDLAALAASFAELAAAGPRERRLGVVVLQAVAEYARDHRR